MKLNFKKYKKLNDKKYKYYTSYGSNCNLEQMYRRCENPLYVGGGFIKDYNLAFNNVATIRQKKGAYTPCVLWKLNEIDEYIMDCYEGFPKKYFKKNVKVLFDGKVYEAFTYIMVESNFDELPFSDYFYTIFQGYKNNNLPVSYLFKALRDCWNNDDYKDDFILYGAYGSNLCVSDMVEYRCPNSLPVGKAILKDYKLVQKGCADIIPSKGDICNIGLWAIHYTDIPALDTYEGYPSFYTKKYFKLGEKICMIYIMRDADYLSKPSKSYYNTIKKGFNDFDMDLELLEKSVEMWEGYDNV